MTDYRRMLDSVNRQLASVQAEIATLQADNWQQAFMRRCHLALVAAQAIRTTAHVVGTVSVAIVGEDHE